MALVECSFESGIAYIAINNQSRRNALSRKVIQEFLGVIEALKNSAARGVVIRSEGTVFSSGHDFADMAGASPSEIRALFEECKNLMLGLHSLKQPVLAAVQGMAMGAGCQLALTCDLIVASEQSAFCTPGGKSGWFCTTPMLAVARNLGPKRALELLMSGDPIPAARAYEWGMVNRVVPHGNLISEANALIAAVTRGSMSSKAIGKQAFYRQISMSEELAYDFGTEVMSSSASTTDGQETMRAFLEKREPRFSND